MRPVHGYARATMRSRHLIAVVALVTTSAGCGDDIGPPPSPPPGALIAVSMATEVGVLLDELPPAARDRLAADLLARPAAFWVARAERQVSTALYRLVYRNLFDETLGQLPLPPVEQWDLEVAAAQRKIIDGHDLVVAPYTFSSTLLTPTEEPELADPILATIGGVVEEVFVLPVDPEHLLERTGYACMDEADFPPGSVDTENAPAFYDDSCEPGVSADGCHLTAPIPSVSCVDALAASVGRADATFRFERVEFDRARADAVRVGRARTGGPQLAAVEAGVRDHRIVYRYFEPSSCAIAEGCVGGAGWRRLLQFTATMENLGDEDMVLGEVGAGSPAVRNYLVSYSACHEHMHFNHYGNFSFGDDAALGSKRAFCLESTSRYSNNETTPLVHPYSCHFQGTARGWGDDYIAGLDCQWIDITTVDSTTPVTAPLGFEVNPDAFLCEGALITDDRGEPLFEPTAFTNEDDMIENRFQCEAFADAAADNLVTADVTVPVPGRGLVTEPCGRFQVGTTRNCGFAPTGPVVTCLPGAEVTLRCVGGSEAVPAAVRVCEASHALGAIPCLYNDARVQVTQRGVAQDVTFTCPAARSAIELGGRAGVYLSPLVGGDDVSSVRCAVR